MNKHIKITKGSPLKYMKDLVPAMLKYIERGDGYNGFSSIKNHHTVTFEFNTGEYVTAYAYETKTLIVMSWGVDDD